MATEEFNKYKYTGSARATVTVEVAINDSWGGECSVGQIHSQAADKAKGIIRQLAKEGVRIIGEPNITAVMAVRQSE